MNQLSTELNAGLDLHLNLNQSFLLNTSSIVVSLQKLPAEAFLNQTIGDEHVDFPSSITLSSNRSASLRVRPFSSLLQFTLERLPSFDASTQTNLSRLVSLSLFDADGNDVEVKTSPNDPFVFWIPHDRSFHPPEMSLQNVTSLTNLSLFNYHFVSLNPHENHSFHFEFRSLNANLSYLFVYRFDLLPIYNRSHQLADGSVLFCASSSDASNFYLDNEQTFGHRSIFIGVGELNQTEVEAFCSPNRSNQTFQRDDDRRNFTSNYFLRLFQSGCFYFDAQHQLKSAGLRVSQDQTNDRTDFLSFRSAR